MTAITEKLKLGHPIEFSATLLRVTEKEPHVSTEKKFWREVSCQAQRGIVVGTRTLWNGRLEWDSDGDEYSSWEFSFFVFEEPVPAFLVAFALNRKPVLVPQSACVAAN